MKYSIVTFRFQQKLNHKKFNYRKYTTVLTINLYLHLKNLFFKQLLYSPSNIYLKKIKRKVMIYFNLMAEFQNEFLIRTLTHDYIRVFL